LSNTSVPNIRGKNWGYGDACAPSNGQVIVDLRHMNRINIVDEKLAYAVIEPGVTQGQLFQFLQDNHPGLWMDATGAGPSASLVVTQLKEVLVTPATAIIWLMRVASKSCLEMGVF